MFEYFAVFKSQNHNALFFEVSISYCVMLRPNDVEVRRTIQFHRQPYFRRKKSRMYGPTLYCRRNF